MIHGAVAPDAASALIVSPTASNDCCHEPARVHPTDHRDGRSHSGHEGPTGHPEASARSHRRTVHDSDHWGGVCIWRPTTSWCRSRLDDLRMSSVSPLREVLARSRDRDSVGSGRLCESIVVGDDSEQPRTPGPLPTPPREVVGADPVSYTHLT